MPSCSSKKKKKENITLKTLKSFPKESLNKQKLKTAKLIPGHQRTDHEAFGDNFMITTQGKNSTLAGIWAIQNGGNIFDAAAAISFTLAVERPHSTGLGGGGFFLVDKPEFRKPVTLDFREQAPLKATSDMFLNPDGTPNNEKSLNGILSVGTPGFVKGVLAFHKKFGKLSREDIMSPAIDLAENGFVVYPELAFALDFRKKELAKYPETKKIFFRNGTPLKEDDWLVQKDLAKTLKIIQKFGDYGFYRGWVAEQIIKETQRLGGLMTHKDLQSYEYKWRSPVHGVFKNLDVYSMGPPSSGGMHIIQILNILGEDDLRSLGIQSSEAIHLTASAMQMAFIDRARYAADEDFVVVPKKALTSKKYARKIRKKIKSRAIKISKDEQSELSDAFKFESNDTTHFTIMDADGNVVSSTQTINYLMGSGIVVPGTGIILNDEMDDFSKAPNDRNAYGAVGSAKNLVAPKKRPLSSMSPTLVKYKGIPVLSLGSPAGTRILTCVTQVLLNYLEHRVPLWEAVSATRFHHQYSPDQIQIGLGGLPKETRKNLIAKGHKLKDQELRCRVQAISKEGDVLHGVSDPRGEGFAAGL